MVQGLVSIITPMYNAKRYVEQTIESVQKQTYPNWEMIIMDDLSDDGCAEVVQELAKADARIKYFRVEEKSGVAKTRNAAMQQASGRYLAFLDSDDLWQADKLGRQLSLMKEKNCAFVYGGCDVIDENGKPQNKVRHVPEHITYQEFLWGNVIPCLTVLIDREKTGDFRMPVLIHCISNILAYSMFYTSIAVSGFISWPVCIVALVVCGVSLWLLRKQKSVF